MAHLYVSKNGKPKGEWQYFHCPNRKLAKCGYKARTKFMRELNMYEIQKSEQPHVHDKPVQSRGLPLQTRDLLVRLATTQGFVPEIIRWHILHSFSDLSSEDVPLEKVSSCWFPILPM